MNGKASLLVLAAAVLSAACASSPPSGSRFNDAGPAPSPRTPVLDTCPATGSTSALPSVTLACLRDGPKVNMAKLGGKPVLVNLWASWCVPCKREMPALQAAYAHYGSQVAFLGVDTKDDVNSANDFLAAVSVHYPEVVDDDGNLLHKVGGAGLPVTLVLDAQGQMVYSHRGQLRGHDLQAALTAAGLNNPQQ